MRDLTFNIVKKTLFVLLLTLLATIYIVNMVNVSDVIEVVGGSDISFILIALLVFYLSIVIRALRWRIFLIDDGVEISKFQVFTIYSNGQYLNLFLPLKLGDVYRAFVTGQESEGESSRIMGTIVSERIIDLLIISVGLMIFAPLALKGSSEITEVILWSGSIVLFLILGVLLMYYVRKNPDKIPYLKGTRSDMFNGVDAVIHSLKKRWVVLPLLSFSIWITNVVRLMFVLEGLGVTIHIFGVFFIALLLALASGVPYIPSGIGVFEVLGSQALIALGMTASTAFAVVIIERTINTVSFAFFGTVIYIYTRIYKETDTDLSTISNFRDHLRE